MKENVLIAPGVDKPAALIRESLDGSLLTVQFLKSVLQRCSKHSVLSDLLETRILSGGLAIMFGFSQNFSDFA